MNKFTYQLTVSDIKTILATLTIMSEILPYPELEELSSKEIEYSLL